MGNSSDETTRLLNESATWSSSNTGVASISSSNRNEGAGDDGQLWNDDDTASYGSQTVTRTLTVQSPSLTSITVAPSAYTIASGTAVQLHATATYSDNTTQDVSALVSWSSTDNTVATASTSGLATGVNPGSTTIMATLNGVSGTASLTVQ